MYGLLLTMTGRIFLVKAAALSRMMEAPARQPSAPCVTRLRLLLESLQSSFRPIVADARYDDLPSQGLRAGFRSTRARSSISLQALHCLDHERLDATPPMHRRDAGRRRRKHHVARRAADVTGARRFSI